MRFNVVMRDIDELGFGCGMACDPDDLADWYPIAEDQKKIDADFKRELDRDSAVRYVFGYVAGIGLLAIFAWPILDKVPEILGKPTGLVEKFRMESRAAQPVVQKVTPSPIPAQPNP